LTTIGIACVGVVLVALMLMPALASNAGKLSTDVNADMASDVGTQLQLVASSVISPSFESKSAVNSGARKKSAEVPVLYRPNSSMIRDPGLYELRSPISVFEACNSGLKYLSENPLPEEIPVSTLTRRRLDELKYVFMQNGVPNSAMKYPEDL